MARLKSSLEKQLSRVVPLDTTLLNSILRMPIENAKESFFNAIEDGLQSWKFKLLPQAKDILEVGIEEDILNNDVPILYFISAKNTIYYRGTVIATPSHDSPKVVPIETNTEQKVEKKTEHNLPKKVDDERTLFFD